MPIVENQEAQKLLIEREIERVVQECQESADRGRKRCFCIIETSVRHEVIERLEKEHKIRVIVNIDSTPSRRMIEKINNYQVEVGFAW
jgi:Mg/Co/Ni transporter MgtE